MIGVEGFVKWGAFESSAAVEEGLNVPDRTWPLAWAGNDQLDSVKGGPTDLVGNLDEVRIAREGSPRPPLKS